MGWSIPKNIPKFGPRPVCKGCQKVIERNENRIRYKFQSHTKDHIKPVHQYHLKVSCLATLKKNDMKLFLEKKWTTKPLQNLQSRLARFVGCFDSDDSDNSSN